MLTIERDRIKLNGKFLPGVVQSISLNGTIIYEKQDGEKEKRKVVLGYEDKEISVDLILYPYDIYGNKINVYEELKKIEEIFKEEKDGKPKTFTFAHPHIESRGLSSVLFKSFESSENVESNVINVSLNFIEYYPAVIKETQEKTQQANKNNQSNQNKNVEKKTKNQTPATEEEPKIEWKKNLKKGEENFNAKYK